MHATEHLAKHRVQIAQFALETGLAFAVVLGRGGVVNVPGGVRDRALLREQQQKDTSE